MSVDRIKAEDVHAGDDLLLLGQPHRVLSIERVASPGLGDYRVALGADGWRMALHPGDRVEVLVPELPELELRAIWGDR